MHLLLVKSAACNVRAETDLVLLRLISDALMTQQCETLAMIHSSDHRGTAVHRLHKLQVILMKCEVRVEGNRWTCLSSV